jgi:hypothetical protein
MAAAPITAALEDIPERCFIKIKFKLTFKIVVEIILLANNPVFSFAANRYTINPTIPAGNIIGAKIYRTTEELRYSEPKKILIKYFPKRIKPNVAGNARIERYLKALFSTFFTIFPFIFVKTERKSMFGKERIPTIPKIRE